MGNSPTSGLIPGPQDIGPGAATAVASMTATTPSHGSGNPTNLGILPSAALRLLPVKPSSTATTLEHTAVSLLGRTNEEQGGITGYRTGPSITDGDLVRNVSRGSGVSIHSPPHVSLGIAGGSLGSNLHSGASPPVLDLNKRLGLVAGEDRLGTGLSQESASSLGAQSQPFAATGAKLGETGGSTVDGAEGNHSGVRIFTPPGISGGQWRPHTASTLKAQQAELVRKWLLQGYVYHLSHRSNSQSPSPGVGISHSCNVLSVNCSKTFSLWNVLCFFVSGCTKFDCIYGDMSRKVLCWKQQGAAVTLGIGYWVGGAGSVSWPHRDCT